MEKKLNILRAGDRNWAYNFISDEHSRYSRHNITYATYDKIKLDNIDLLYIHSPDITSKHALYWPLEAQKRGIKVIGGYAGNPEYWHPEVKKVYSYADLIVTISPQTYQFAKEHYKNIPVIFLPESIDTKFFTPQDKINSNFTIGIACSMQKPIKRGHIAKKLDYPILIKDNWAKQINSQISNLDQMKEFYKELDVLLCTSLSECQPRTIMEAMACKKCVISTDVGSVKMLLDSEWIVPVNPEEEVIKQINYRLEILKNFPTIRSWVAQRNLEHINTYWSWKNNTYLWDDIFELVCNNLFTRAEIISEVYLKNSNFLQYLK
jgi:glycosyltransferase involved in cell wall biosynthesis